MQDVVEVNNTQWRTRVEVGVRRGRTGILVRHADGSLGETKW